MSIDIIDLKEFYRSSLSKRVNDIVKKMLKRLRQTEHNNRTLFVGFGAPYADKFQNEFLLMQAHFGVLAWPDSQNNRALLAYEGEWAFADHIFDEIIIIHGLEYAQHASNFLQECYRCLRPEGRLVVVVPNRRSIWVRSDKTPFGFGQPYTLTQLSMILKKCGFIPVDVVRGLYTFPSSTWLGSLWSWIFECIASRALQKFSGLFGVSAIKRVYAGIPLKKTEKEQRIAIPQATLG
jgi:SAM-dependent methyltransferase